MSAHLMLGDLVAIALRVTVLLTIAALADLGLRRRASAMVRHMVWSLAVIGALALPLFQTTLPALSVPILPATTSAPAEPTVSAPLPAPPLERRNAPPVRYETAPSPESTEGVENPAAVAAERPFNWIDLLLFAYVSGALLVLLGVGIDHLRLRRLTKGSVVLDDEPWTLLLRRLADRSGVRRRVQLLQSVHAVVPFTSGVVRPVIVVPIAADSWSTDQREAVLLHELAHVARYDCLTQLLAAVACALYWPHPFIWRAAARLRVEREHACDDLVLARGISPSGYAKQLLTIARAVGAPMPRLAVSMATTSDLESRLRAVIDESRRRDALGRPKAIFVVGAALLLVTLVATVRPAHGATALPLLSPAVVTPAPQVRPAPTAAPQAAPRAEMPNAQGGASASQFSGEFTARPVIAADGSENAGLVHFALRTPGLNTFYVAPARLEGLSNTAFAGDGPVHFRLRRDAGTLDFAGTARSGRAFGRFVFEPDTSYNRELARRGIDAVSPAEQFEIARHDLPLAYIDELRKQGYATLTPADIVSASMTGADIQFLRDMDTLGYRQRTLGALLRLWNVGVEPPYIRALSAVGYRGLAAEDLVRLRSQSIDAAFIAAANESAGRTLTVDELERYRNGGKIERESAASPRMFVDSTRYDRIIFEPLVDDTVVTGRWTIGSRRDGWLQLDIEWANVNQWKAFVSPADLVGITRSEITGGLTNASFRILQDAGSFSFTGRFERGTGAGEFRFSPNTNFAATLRALGVRDAQHVGVHQLKNLAFAFMSADSVREFMAGGLTPLSLRELLDLSVFRVTPSYMNDLRAAGVREATSPETLVELKNIGVSGAYARELAALGYTSLSASQLSAMHGAGVTPALIREQREASGRALTPEELVARSRERR